MLQIDSSSLVVIDIQGRLAQLMHKKDMLFKNVRILIQAATILEIPIIWCQQAPESLGQTAPKIKKLLVGLEPVNKASFSCCGEDKFNQKVHVLGRNQFLLCGIETHVCIYQTAIQLKEQGKHVEVISDAVSSRTPQNKKTALEKMRTQGISITSTEMVLFELVKTAAHPKFKHIAALIK